MILSMSEQAREFLMLVLAGMAAGAVYDIIRVLRRCIRHSILMVHTEDLIYWLLFTLVVMLVILWQSNGVLRVFSVAAPIIGMTLYFGALSRFFMPPAVLLMEFIKKIFMVILHIICIPLTFFGKILLLPLKKAKKMLLKFTKIVKKLLKKILKYEKIIDGSLVDDPNVFRKAYRCNRVERREEKKKKQ